MDQDLLKKHIYIFQGIHKYKKDTCPLCTLVNILQKTSFRRGSRIPEFVLLDRFPETDELIPEELFSPRWIIEYMKKVHEINSRNSIAKSTNDGFVYKYNSDDEEDEKSYVFSSNMTLDEDIITICYLYCIMKTYEYKEFPQVIELIEKMKKKYTIHDGLDTSKLSTERDSKKVTWFKIAYSYPSITFSIFHYGIVDMPLPVCTAFSNFDLPKIFNLPLFTLIVPALDLGTPLTLLLAFNVFTDSNNERTHEITSVDKLWHYTYQLFFSKVFPSSLKLQLCEQWGIVHRVENQYKYAFYFKETHNEAVALISRLKSDDPGLKNILRLL
ncbi:uncharacterized protein LOC114254707 [Monomorium pharaonis]|uniref:uncharacterized protein LOC114254707 n=1 Tax=Monomorium pharaonis TaxID=307658 RepID=UPI00102E1FCC|nr:uncharacterized protein LOC114254707 [Monomorium pharaonis]